MLKKKKINQRAELFLDNIMSTTNTRNESFTFQCFIDYLEKYGYTDEAATLSKCFERKCHLDDRILKIIGRSMQRSRLSENQQLQIFQELSQYVYDEEEDFRSQIESKEEQLESLNFELGISAEKLLQVTQENEDLKAKLTDKENKIGLLHSIVLDSKEELQLKDTEIEKLCSQLQQLKKEVKSKKESIDNLTHTCQELESKNERIKDEHKEQM